MLKEKTIAILGYGSQGRSHALNLRDEGYSVLVGARLDGPSWHQAIADGFHPLSLSEAAAKATLVMMLMSDEAQAPVYASIESKLQLKAALGFAHGYALHFQQILPRSDLEIFLAAPKVMGPQLRARFLENQVVPVAIAGSTDLSTAYAQAITKGCMHLVQTTFEEETITNLFTEQAVLVGGLIDLMIKGFETLVQAGVNPELAYLECVDKLSILSDALTQKGFTTTFEHISTAAAIGAITRGPRVIDNHVQNNMHQVLDEIKNGKFSEDLNHAYRTNLEDLKKFRSRLADHSVEQVGTYLIHSIYHRK